MEKASSNRWEMVPCKKGTYKSVKGKDGAVKYKQLSKLEIDNDVDDQPCDCVICDAREKNTIEAVSVGSSRVRKDRFSKYGAGQKLGFSTL